MVICIHANDIFISHFPDKIAYAAKTLQRYENILKNRIGRHVCCIYLFACPTVSGRVVIPRRWLSLGGGKWRRWACWHAICGVVLFAKSVAFYLKIFLWMREFSAEGCRVNGLIYSVICVTILESPEKMLKKCWNSLHIWIKSRTFALSKTMFYSDWTRVGW